MKRILCFAISVLMLFGLQAQNRFPNHPLPSNPDTLRILAIGNSFSDDGTENHNIVCTTAGAYDIYVNGEGQFWIQAAAAE